MRLAAAYLVRNGCNGQLNFAVELEGILIPAYSYPAAAEYDLTYILVFRQVVALVEYAVIAVFVRKFVFNYEVRGVIANGSYAVDFVVVIDCKANRCNFCQSFLGNSARYGYKFFVNEFLCKLFKLFRRGGNRAVGKL